MEKQQAALSRRRVVCGLVGVGGAALAATAPGGSVLGQAVGALSGRKAAAARAPVSLAQGSYEDWTRAVGTSFAAPGGYRLKLAGVRPIGSAANRAGAAAVAGLRGRAFVALLDLTGGQSMPGDLIYRVVRGQERFDLYLGATDRTRRMQAVFG